MALPCAFDNCHFYIHVIRGNFQIKNSIFKNKYIYFVL